MNPKETEVYTASYELHRLYYETADEARDADFWRQVKDGIDGLGKYNAQSAIIKVINLDVITAYENHKTRERVRIGAEQAKAAEREREENARAEARAKHATEVERLERELAQARAAL